jgi:glycosyltransferase involved in cell wall biosynthesis
MPRVAVCIATFRRPEGLSALLASLGGLAFSRRRAEVVLVVADNDAAESARPVIEAAAGALEWSLHYVVEPERNIAGARNRAVGRALEDGADFVAFVDDDETVAPEWLDELLDAQAACGADVVQGRVVPRFEPGTPAWLSGAWVYGVSLPPRGTTLPVASTNNVLVRASLLAGGRPFDPAFGLSGGEDSLFFTRAAREGALIVSAPDAVAREHVVPARARPGWVLRRAFRGGNTALHCEYALPRSTRAPAGRLARATLRLGASAALLPLSPLLGRAGALRALSGICYGVGCWAALAGYRYFEYRALSR